MVALRDGAASVGAEEDGGSADEEQLEWNGFVTSEALSGSQWFP